MSINTTSIAAHPAPCPRCSAFIQVGDPIVRANGFDQWQHARCPETKFDFDPTNVCAECFTVRATNGACACP